MRAPWRWASSSLHSPRWTSRIGGTSPNTGLTAFQASAWALPMKPLPIKPTPIDVHSQPPLPRCQRVASAPAARTSDSNRMVAYSFLVWNFHPSLISVASSPRIRPNGDYAVMTDEQSPHRPSDFQALRAMIARAPRQPAEAAGAGRGLRARQSRRDRLRHRGQHRRQCRGAAVDAGALSRSLRLPGVLANCRRCSVRGCASAC